MERFVIKGCEVFTDGRFVPSDVEVDGGIVSRVEPGIVPAQGIPVFSFDNCRIVPGLVDVHVHLREPGFSYKETMATGTAAAARGGYTAVCAMPNLNPVPDSAEHLAAELEAIRRGASVDVCHVSTKESVELIRQAKRRGVDVTAETAPHYLLLTDADLQEDGRFKMNPPLRGEADRAALIEALLDGTIDMIATDHAPHSAEEKSTGGDGRHNARAADGADELRAGQALQAPRRGDKGGKSGQSGRFRYGYGIYDRPGGVRLHGSGDALRGLESQG